MAESQATCASSARPKFTVGRTRLLPPQHSCWAVLGPRRYDVMETLTGLVVKAPTGRKSCPTIVSVDRAKGDASRDEFAVFERATDPLHRAGINPEPFSDLAHARSSGSRQSLLDALFQLRSYSRPPEPFSLALGPR